MKNLKLFLLAAVIAAAALPATAQLSDTYVIAAAANQRGAFGTHWKTRFTIFNPHLDETLWVSVTFLPTGGRPQPNPNDEFLIELPPNALAYSDNILEDLYETEGGGSLLVATFADDNPHLPNDMLSRSFLVTTDTYNNPNDTGTFGQTIPGVWTGLLDYDTDKISAIVPMVRNTGIWRTNIGAVNLGRCEVSLFVSAYDGDGNTVLDQARFPIPPLAHNQLPLPVALEVGSVEFSVNDPCANDSDRLAVVFPYTSTIDRRTGDPTYGVPTLLADPDDLFFAKGQAVDPRTIGTKIDGTFARKVRDQAERRGAARLTRDLTGWKITQ